MAIRGLARLVIFLGLSTTGALGSASAETIVFRSGAGLTTPGSRDTTIHLLKGPTASAFQSAFTTTSFARARSESTAKLTTLNPDWIPKLTADPLARWVNQSGESATGSTALYSRDFHLDGPLNSVRLLLRYAVDNTLGTTTTAGIYVNGVAVPGTMNLGDYHQQWTLSADITSLVHVGTNTLYLYGRNTQFDAGIMFSAVVLVNPTDATTCELTTMGIDPRGTYLRTNQDTAARNASRISLSQLNVVAGDTLRLARRGAFAYVPGGEQVGYTLDCVFSADSVLLGPSSPARVPGAIAAGTPYVTAPTYYRGLATDIPQDFAVTDTFDVVVPGGAKYLFACADDEFYGDNEDPDGDFGLSVLRDCPTDAVEPFPASVQRRLQLTVSPNPVLSRLRFSWVAPARGPVQFSLFDVNGRLVQQWGRSAEQDLGGIEDISLSSVALGAGVPRVLLVRMAQAGLVTSRKVIVLPH
ncbi:MAG: T9SS type A sorting domain-containing protein [Nocardioidaceae bacterium]